MTRFKKHDSGYRYLINNGIEWRLYHYTPRNNEFERGLKYALYDCFYLPEWGEYRNIRRGLFSSIKQAVEYIKGV